MLEWFSTLIFYPLTTNQLEILINFHTLVYGVCKYLDALNI